MKPLGTFSAGRRPCSSARGFATLFLAALLAIAFSVRAADPLVQSAQGALRERGFYSGEISGTFDEQTRAAVRRFQIREGLPISGEIDSATAGALQIPSAAAPPIDQAIPGIPPGEIPMRERMRVLQQTDEEFLREVEEQEASARRRDLSSRPPPPPRQETAARPPSREPEAAPAPAGVTDEEVLRFVERFIRASEGRTPDAEVALYGERVDYFGSARVTRQAIARDQERYYRRWPSREFTLVGDPQIVRRTEDTATVRYRLSYRLRSDKEATRGQLEHFVRLEKDDAGRLRIVAIRERKSGD